MFEIYKYIVLFVVLQNFANATIVWGRPTKIN